MPNIEFHPKQLKFARVNALADGDNTLIAAPSGGVNEAILVLGYSLRFIGAGAFQLKSGAAGSVHLDEVGLAAPGQRVQFNGGDGDGVAAFQCDPGAALVVNNFATGDVTGHITYRIIRVV